MIASSHLQHVSLHCALCGADDALLLHTLRYPPGQALYSDADAVAVAGVEKLVRCRRCGLVYMQPQPRPLAPWRTYSAAQEAAYFGGTVAVRERGALRLLALLEHRLGQAGRLLDIGCGDGALLRVAQQRGWRVAGIEASPQLVAQVRRLGALGDCVIEGRAEALPPDLGSFDAVALLNVLEHVYEPALALTNASRVLRPGGLLAVHAPNYAWGRLWGARWHQLEPLDHLTYFTPKTLAGMLTKVGLTKVARFSLPGASRWRARLQDALNRLGLWPGSGLGLIAVKKGQMPDLSPGVD